MKYHNKNYLLPKLNSNQAETDCSLKISLKPFYDQNSIKSLKTNCFCLSVSKQIGDGVGVFKKIRASWIRPFIGD